MQILSTPQHDPDSQGGNGFNNGEDDEVVLEMVTQPYIWFEDQSLLDCLLGMGIDTSGEGELSPGEVIPVTSISCTNYDIVS